MSLRPPGPNDPLDPIDPRVVRRRTLAAPPNTPPKPPEPRPTPTPKPAPKSTRRRQRSPRAAEGTFASIPRHQRYLFFALAAGILTALAFLLYGCRQAEKRLAAPEDETPIAAPTSSGQESVPLFLAHDADGSILPEDRPLALPSEPSGRARVLLEQLLAAYALPNSPHPLPSGQAIDDVFLLPLPLAPPPPAPTSSKSRHTPPPPQPLYGLTGELAVINLHGTFCDAHPSGVEVETLTLNSIIGTLHADFPDVTAVRFLVDGRDRDTLAGHADLLRTYPATDTTFKP